MSNPIDGCRIGRLALIRVTSSGCPKGSGCCPTSRASDASEDDENGTAVAFNPDSTFDNQETGESSSGDPVEESIYEETSATPSDYEYENFGEEPTHREISAIPSDYEYEIPGEETASGEINEIPSDEEYEAYGCVPCALLSPRGT